MGGACENEDSVRQHDKRVYDKVIETEGNSAKWSNITKAKRCVALCYAPFVLYAIRLDICDS